MQGIADHLISTTSFRNQFVMQYITCTTEPQVPFFAKDTELKSELLNNVSNEIREVCKICRTEETLFMYDNTIKWRNSFSEIQSNVPPIFKILENINCQR